MSCLKKPLEENAPGLQIVRNGACLCLGNHLGGAHLAWAVDSCRDASEALEERHVTQEEIDDIGLAFIVPKMLKDRAISREVTMNQLQGFVQGRA